MSSLDVPCTSQQDILEALDRLAPDAPFLALGQTIFWDEPVKAGVAARARELGHERRFVAGIHDADYFAKLPGKIGEPGYHALPHNDTTTQSLWSAAAEFAQLFGSETVITRDALTAAGIRLHRLQNARPGILDTATEAWGWRGIAAVEQETHVVAETPLKAVLPEIQRTLAWALGATVDQLAGSSQAKAAGAADALNDLVLHAATSTDQSLSSYYENLLPSLYRFSSGDTGPIETTTTTKLLKFNTLTAQQDRFLLLEQFLNPVTRGEAVRAYNETVAGTEVYPLDRFGSWAIPFDLIVPGRGRGTVRIAPKAVVIMTPEPLFITLKRPVTCARELAQAIEGKFGPDCALVGKAITLIGMLAREFVFVFHEGASMYVRHSRELHKRLYPEPPEKPLHPILRVRLEPWDALHVCSAWFRVPQPMQQAFGGDEMCAPSFAARWRDVAAEQRALVEELPTLRSPVQFIRWLAQRGLGSWRFLSDEYARLHAEFEAMSLEVQQLRTERQRVMGLVRAARARRNALEHEKGRHWRTAIFEKTPSEADLAHRAELQTQIEAAATEAKAHLDEWRQLRAAQETIVGSDRVLEIHAQRRNIELEAELKKLKLARQAIIISWGLQRAAWRPSAWWFPMVCPSGLWFRETHEQATYSLEPLR